MSSSKLADTLVERFDLTPPVDVRQLLERSAAVEEIAWPYEVDGLVLGLRTSRPRALIRENQALNRKRFTIAHEWAHICIPWHIESALSCHVAPVSVASYGQHEREANEFAARILLPDRYVSQVVVDSADVTEWLKGISRCQVSAHASLISLLRYIPAGYTFTIEQPGPRLPIILRSPGTPLFREAGQGVAATLSENSFDSGSYGLSGKTVSWYQHIDTSHPVVAGNPDSAHYLQLIVDKYGEEIRPGRSTRLSINGIIGGKLNRRDGLNAGQMLGVLRLHLSYDPDFHQLLGDNDFDRFLAARVMEISARRS